MCYQYIIDLRKDEISIIPKTIQSNTITLIINIISVKKNSLRVFVKYGHQKA
jgi:hypothetical protein